MQAGIVVAARHGDRAAWQAVYNRYARMVHGVALVKMPAAAAADAEDVVQEVFIAAMKRIGELRDDAAIGAWLAGMARNMAANHRRSRARAALRLAGWSRRAPDRNGREDDPEAISNAMAILRLIRDLPEAYQEPLVWRLVEGMSGPEIAAATGLTEGSVRVNLSRGMKMLRERMEAPA